MSDIWRAISGGHRRRQFARAAQRLRAASFHAGRLPDEVDVVGVVPHAVVLARLAHLEVRAVGLHGALVRRHGILVAAHAEVDVRGHVDQVARARHQRTEAVGRGRAAVGLGAGLDRVDVEMEGARMVGGGGQHALERLDDLLRAGLGLPVLRPQVPRPQVHQGVGEEGGGVGIVGKLPRDLAHGVGVRAVERRAVGLGIGRVADGLRLDGGALPRGCLGGQRPRLLHRLPRPALALGVGGAVVVRAVGQRDAPVAHRAVRIETRRLAEGALGLRVVEAVHQAQSLVEVGLGLGRAGRDLLRIGTEVGEEGWRRGIGARGVLVGRR